MNAILQRLSAVFSWPGRAIDNEDGDLRALRSHPRRLLYIAGALLGLLLLCALAAAVALHVRSYHEDRLQGFARAQSALAAQLTRHDASYARLVNMTEYAWQHRMDSDPATLAADALAYLGDGQRLVLQQGERGAPQLVMGLGTERWPAERLQRYLALSRSMSTISRMAFAGTDVEAAGAAYFLDPTGHLAVLNQGLADSDASASLPLHDREQRFAQMRAYANLSPPASPGDSVPALRPASGNGRARLGFAAHPVTGRPSLVSVFPAHDGTRGLGVFVAFEPTDGLARVLREASDSNLLVVAPNGEVILGSRAGNERHLVGTLHEAGIWTHARSGVTLHRRGGQFYIAALVAGTDWSLVTTYGWREMLADGQRLVVLAAVVWTVLMTVLWLLLAWIDRRILAPAARRAGRVYASEQLFRSLIQMTPIGLCLIDSGRAVPVVQNELAQRYSGAAERAGLPLYEALLQGHAAATAGPEENMDVREFELSHCAARKVAARHLLVRATEVVHQGRMVLLCALQDLTARVELQEQRDRLHEDAEAANRAKLHFLAMMSHEIRTPLHGILGHLELFGRSRLDAEQRTRLRRIIQSADSLLQIINDVLDLERIEAGRMEVELVDFEPVVLLERVALLYAPLAQGKGVDLDLVVDASLAPLYRGALGWMEQVLRNLVSNAIKFTASGRIEIRILPARQMAGLRLEVADSGIGLSEAQQQRLFQPFMQADETISDRFGGSGLGLSLCRQLCQLMGGDIDVRSTPGVGSVFGFNVPVQPGPQDDAVVSRPLAGRTILVHSAVATWRDELSRRLRGWGAVPLPLEQLGDVAQVAGVEGMPLVLFERNLPVIGDEALQRCERVVRVRADGPLHASRRQGHWRASCYSGQSLLEALGTGDGQGPGMASRGPIMAAPAAIG